MITANSINFRLAGSYNDGVLTQLTVDEVRNRLHEHFNNVMVFNPGAEAFVSSEGLVNGELGFTKTGFHSLAVFLGWNANTLLDQYKYDPDYTTGLINSAMKPHLDDDHLRFIRQGDNIEGVVTDGYGEISTPEVFDHYLDQNPGSLIESVNVTGLNSRIIATPRNPGIISNEDREIGDIMRVGHELSNGMGGKMSCSYGLILMRLACLNGMVLADKSHMSRVRHVGEGALTRALNSIQASEVDLNRIHTLINTAQDENLQGRRVEFLHDKVKGELGKKMADGVIQEYDVPDCPSRRRKPGNTLYDYWNSLTYTAKDDRFKAKQRDAEKFAWDVLKLGTKLPIEDMPGRQRTERPLVIEV
jgi:hypothetical protein